MRQRDLEKQLENAVAEALGLPRPHRIIARKTTARPRAPRPAERAAARTPVHA